MGLCDFNSNLRLSYGGCTAAATCPVGVYKKEAVWEGLALAEIVPEGLCPSAYYSMIPYWVSFRQSAWFRWRKDKDTVNCQCPRKNGVNFLVRRVREESGTLIRAEVIQVGQCPYGHKNGRIIRLENRRLCPALYPSVYSGLCEPESLHEFNVRCCIFSHSALIKGEPDVLTDKENTR